MNEEAPIKKVTRLCTVCGPQPVTRFKVVNLGGGRRGRRNQCDECSRKQRVANATKKSPGPNITLTGSAAWLTRRMV